MHAFGDQSPYRGALQVIMFNFRLTQRQNQEIMPAYTSRKMRARARAVSTVSWAVSMRVESKRNWAWP